MKRWPTKEDNELYYGISIYQIEYHVVIKNYAYLILKKILYTELGQKGKKQKHTYETNSFL